MLSANSAAGEAAVQRVVERYAKSMGGYRATVCLSTQCLLLHIIRKHLGCIAV